MSIESLLTDRCDIYHLDNENTSTPTFGVPVEDFQKEFSYPKDPDETVVKSYFSEENQNIVQSEPNNQITETLKAFFLLETDIRKNDKVVFDGDSYIAQKPKQIKNSHIEVKVKRSDSL